MIYIPISMEDVIKKKLRNIKLVVLDLDGTLIDNQNNLSIDTITLINKLKGKGVKFSIASGRIFNSFQNYINDLGIDIPVIALDGTYIIDPVNKKIIVQYLLNYKHVQRALKLSEKYSLNVALCDSETIYYTKENSLIKFIINKCNADYKLVESYEPFLHKTYEIILISAVGEQLRNALKKMIFPYTFGIHTSFYKSRSNGENYLAEIRKMGVDKGKALVILCEYLKIKIDETAVIGDWYNDISLFRTKAFKVAMTNAIPEIKKLANMITEKDNNEYGVNEFLYKLLKAKE